MMIRSTYLKYKPSFTSFNSLVFNKRGISYVEKSKYTQEIKEKENEIECRQLIPQGKFLLYKGSKPFLKPNTKQPKEVSFNHELNWLSYADLTDHKAAVTYTSVLIDVDDQKCPRFGVQLGKLDATSSQKLETHFSGIFTDLRASLFMVDWRNAHVISRANALLMFHVLNAFCGKCGNKNQRNAAGSSRTCKKCDTTVYPHSSPVGIVLVTNTENTHAVLVRQSRHPSGMFTCIAGFGDVGETLEETVRREVAEEVGLEVERVDYVMSQHWPFPDSIMFGCYAVAEKKPIDIDLEELEDGRWFSRQEVTDAIERAKNIRDVVRVISTPIDGVFIPPRGTLSFHLIHHWIKNTPSNKIYNLIT